ncbi:MAG: hypothetical protein ACYC9Y_14430 [Candidatus Methylomirabilia bacterium]
MRGARALAAAVILAFAFGASGCELVSSLTPFGIGTQDYGGGAENINGTWEGQTSSGGVVTFQVGSDAVSQLHFHHVAPGCTVSFEALTLTPLVVDGVFTLDMPLDVQGRFVVTGTFTSATTCSGTYFFEALPAGTCPTAGSGTFFAGKIY